ncbi:MAG: glycoside hydrolase family 16 protein [Thermoleophilaceae bacterium]|nr:glycoside hydrolase family 16 protein [Thermoleophilaceae bacterium]
MARVPLLLLLLPVLPLLLPADSALAAAPRLIVLSPTPGKVVASRVPIRVRLELSKNSRVFRARFLVNGVELNFDRRLPLTTRRGATYDSGLTVAGKRHLHITADYTFHRESGSHEHRTRLVERNVQVEVFRPPPEGVRVSAVNAGWKPQLDDSFDEMPTTLDHWNAQRDDWIKGGIPYSNLEGAGYATSNVSIEDGVLKLRTSNTPAAGYPTSTGSINSHHVFEYKYGYLESRIRVPRCNGCWPSFWMLPGEDGWPPEIDIFEFFNTLVERFPYSSLHWEVDNAAGEEYRNAPLRAYVGQDLVESWHTYSLLWTEDQVQFYLDGNPGPQFAVPSQVPHELMYPIIQLAIIRGLSAPAGSTMEVDYVRAWQKQGDETMDTLRERSRN